MGETFQNWISNICSAASAFMLICNLCYNYFADNIPILDTALEAPFDYIVTFLPITVGILIHCVQVVEEGFHGPKTVKYVLKPIVFILTVLGEFIVIKRFSMYAPIVFEGKSSFLLGILILLGISVIEASAFAFLENDSIHAVFVRYTFWKTWFVLSAVNGCLEAGCRISTYTGENRLDVWIVSSIVFTIIYAVYLLFYTLLMFAKTLVYGAK